MLNATAQFRDAIQSAGLIPPDVIEADGKLHRFASSGKHGDDAGWYSLHGDGIPAGSFGDWRNGFSQTWRADIGRKLTPAEDAVHRAKVEAMRQEREATKAREQAEAATRAADIWKAAKPAPADHAYLVRKGIDAGRVRLNGDALAIPMITGGKIQSLQFIGPDGDKRFLTGGRVTGCYFSIGDSTGATALCIAEGFATGATIHQATGYPVAVAFNAGNLGAVAKTLRGKFPDLHLILCGDVDKSGTGQKAATEAAQAVGGAVVLPSFTPEELAGDKPPSDFNDLAQLRGADAVGHAIAGASAPGKATHQAEPESAPAGEFASCVELLRGSDVKPEAVTWLWPGWLAAGKMHVLGGAPGTGKTTISMALAATVTTGGRWPDGSRSPVGNVVIWSGEDDPADTLVPRLALSGADLSRVYFIADVFDGGGRRSFDLARDMEPLRRKLGEIGDVCLLIVDPIVSAVMGDSHKNAEVRRSLQPLVDLAAFMRCALLGITHFSKGTGGRDPVERLTGSLAFGALARVVLVAAKQQEDGEDGRTVRIFLRAKSNIGPDDGGFEYDLHQAEMKTHPGIFSSSVLWGAAVEGGARELLATADATSDDGEGGTLADAKSFLGDLLADGPLGTKALKADADGAGYSWATIRRALKAIGAESHKDGMRGGWQWSISRSCSRNPEDAQQKEVSTFGNFEHLRPSGDAVEVEV